MQAGYTTDFLPQAYEPFELARNHSFGYEIEGRKRVTGKWKKSLHRFIILKMLNPSSDIPSGRTLAHSSLHTISMRSLSLKLKSSFQRRRGRCEQDQSDL
jgi:hypothetical protein